MLPFELTADVLRFHVCLPNHDSCSGDVVLVSEKAEAAVARPFQIVVTPFHSAVLLCTSLGPTDARCTIKPVLDTLSHRV